MMIHNKHGKDDGLGTCRNSNANCCNRLQLTLTKVHGRTKRFDNANFVEQGS